MAARTLAGRTCGGCGSPIMRPAGKRGPLPVYCGSACRWKAGHRADAARRAELRAGLTCEGCGAVFDSPKRRNRFCSRRCGDRHTRRPAGGSVG